MAEGKGKLYITISDERGGGTPTPSPKPREEEKKKDDVLGRFIEHEVFHLVKEQAMAFANFTLGNIGNFTGDYITQAKVSEMRKNAQGFINIGITTLAGAKYGMVGAAVGFVVGTISEVSKGVYEVIEKQNSYSKQNYEIAQLRDRSGLNTLLDGSRGTEN